MSSTATPVAQSSPEPASAGIESAPETAEVRPAGPVPAGECAPAGTVGSGSVGRKAATDYAAAKIANKHGSGEVAAKIQAHVILAVA